VPDVVRAGGWFLVCPLRPERDAAYACGGRAADRTRRQHGGHLGGHDRVLEPRPQPITLTAVQSANCVDGAWRSDDGRWLGAISGLATGDAYVGQISLVPADDRERCEGVANVDGPITATSLRWTAAALEIRGTCQRELPRGLVITLRKR